MEVDRPGPGEELNAGAAATAPRQAASVVLVRGGGEALELLLVQRSPEQRFMGGAWVFPGGAVDAGEGEGDEAHRAAGLRELAEEAGVVLDDARRLVKWSRWITPEEVRIRFDTHFFLAECPPDAAPRCDGRECVDLRWFTPQGALEAHRAGEILLVFPTIKHLEQFAGFDTASALVAHARGQEVVPVRPRVVMSGETARVLLPGEPGYEE